MQATTCCPTYPNEPAARLCQNESADIWHGGGIRAPPTHAGFQAAQAGFASAAWAGGYGRDGLVEDMWGDAAQGGFYFGEFEYDGRIYVFEKEDYQGKASL